MKEHILVISQYFYPENFRINDICKEWVKKGYKVTVITGIPNYPQGEFFKGYGWFKKRKDNYEGVNVIRIPIVSRGNSGIRLMLNYISYVISGFWWKLFTKIKADKVFIFQLSPMTQALVGVWYAKKRKIPCYIYVQDLWPENVESVTGIRNKYIIGPIDKMVNYVYKRCNKIFVTSPSFVKRIEERASAWEKEESKVIYWPQYAEEFYKPARKVELSDMPQNDKLKFVFTGNIGYAQGLDILPKVAVLLKKEKIDCQFVIIGDGRYREEFEKEVLVNNVEEMFSFLGRKNPEEIPNYLAWCDVAYLSFADDPLLEMTIPAKLQSYMACGMPILAVAGGETKRIIEEAECGWCCEERVSEEIVEAIKDIMELENNALQIMSKNAIKYYVENFDKQKLFDKLAEYKF